MKLHRKETYKLGCEPLTFPAVWQQYQPPLYYSAMSHQCVLIEIVVYFFPENVQ